MRQDADRARAKEMFHRMSTQEKINYIFQYYWPHMLAGVVSLLFAVVFVTSYWANASTRDHLYIGIQSEYHDLLRPEVETLAQAAQWPEGLNFRSFPSAQSKDGMGSIQLSMYLTADELDFIVCDEYTMHLLTSDETMNCAAVPFEDTYLGMTTDVDQPLYILALYDTTREEKAAQFMPVLMCPLS